jgi:hypothetical protein
MVVGGRRVRLFAVVALVFGFAEMAFTVSVSSYVNYQRPTSWFLPAARYSTLPIVLIDAIGILGVDAYLRRHGPARLPAWSRTRSSLRSLIAVGVLACVLGFGWASDFRYSTQRTGQGFWRVEALRWLRECEQSPTGQITIPSFQHRIPVECTRLRR